MDWDDVRYFLALARQRSLSGAARVLHVEHSTVARRVQGLETRLGVRLFDRLPRSWPLTAEGEALLAHAGRMEEEALAFGRAALGAGALTGTVRLSVPPVFGSHFLVPRLAALRHQWQGIVLDLTGEARAADLHRGEADLAVRLSRPQEPGLAARKLGDMGYGLYGSHGWIGKRPEAWVFLGYGAPLREVPQQRWLARLAGERPFALHANDLATLHHGCRAGLGLAVLPHFLARDDPALFAMGEADAALQRGIWLAVHPDVRRSPRVRAVADALAMAVREAAGSLL
ncbi:LysR family transcriptional regulator [Cupriavidus basilensis]|uniref:LysR family transcriptional regulator n=1 Tax=Cupriavidus basilensis TaxID=68895 RepID=A0ABT6B2M8_9BURK|nr:LysR family transcriptional regulator [Cupriavidus basilensis]MDF3839137.1 LysR family transcriptional regulator [Cupriavidus basilensis]